MKIRIITYVLILLLILVLFGRHLNPFSNQMFEFHDVTQAARVQQFTLNLKGLKLPPRTAPDFNFKLSYPVFNFYAPTGYWITGGLNLIGFDIVNSLKISFLLAIVFAFISSFLFLGNFYKFHPSLLGGILYITSLYLPANIFVRGNLAEVWFISLLPLSLFFIYKNAEKLKPLNFVLGVIVLSLTYTSHNLLSMIFIPLSLIFALLLKNKKQNLLAIALAFLLSGYFLIPLFLESHLTIARQMAIKTNYQDHFLCLRQLWQSPWGFGGSIPGCNDGMSFKLGKLQIIFAGLGIILFLTNILKKKKVPYLLTTNYLLLLMLFSLLMTTYFSKPVWDLFSPILAVFQFPWRFIALSLISLSFFSSYFWNNIHLPFKSVIILLFAVGVLIFNAKYFQGRNIAKSDYEEKYLSQEFIEKKAAFLIPEYFSNFPDTINKPVKNKIGVKQTTVEKTANLITLLTLIFMIFVIYRKPLWKKIVN